MRTFNLLLIIFIFFSCKKSTESVAARLLKMEATSYNGDLFHTEYGYDNQGRITTITNYTNSEPPRVAVSIQVIQSSVDKDISGSVVFTGSTAIDIERTYNTDGLLSTENILSRNTQYIVTNYFYGR